MSQNIGAGYLTPLEYAETQNIKMKIKMYDTELGGTADDGRLIGEITGVVTGGNFSFKDTSDMFASGNLTMIVDDILNPMLNQKCSLWWYRLKVKLYKIYEFENGIKTEIPFGVFTVADNSWDFNSSSYILNMTLNDCMESLTADSGNTIIGRAAGHHAPSWAYSQFESIVIKAGSDINTTIQDFSDNYSPFAYPYSFDGIYGDATIPYDIQADSSSGLYEIFSKIKGLVPAGRLYFDATGTLHFGQSSMRWAETCHCLGKHLTNLVISEKFTSNPSSYRDSIVVWGGEVKVDDDTYNSITATETTDTGVPVITDPTETGKYFGVAVSNDGAIFEDTKNEVISNDGLNSNLKCREMAKYELYKKNRFTETVTVTIVDRPLPMLDRNTVLNVGKKIEYTSVITGETNLYILRELSNNLNSGTITLVLDKFYEFYPQDDYQESLNHFPSFTYNYTVDVEENILHIELQNTDNKVLLKVFVDNAFCDETCTDSIDIALPEGQNYIQLFAYNPTIKQEEFASFSVDVGTIDEDYITLETGEPMITQRGDNIIFEMEIE